MKGALTMRWFLLALALVAGVGQSQEPPKSETAKNKGTSEQRGSEQAPLFVKTPSPSTQDERDYETYEKYEKPANDKKITAATVALAYITFFLALFTAGLWYATYRLVREGKETSQRQLRAYVHCAEVPTNLDVRAQQVIHGNIYFVTGARITIKWENAGLTPAKDCMMWTSYKFLPVDQPIDLAFKKAERSEPVKMLLGPKGRIDSIPIHLSVDQMMNIFDKKARAFLWGLSEYRDIFSKESAPPKHTEICLEIVIDVDPRTAIDREHPPMMVAFQGVPMHNSAS